MTTTFDGLVNEVRATLRGYGLIRDGVAFLSADINSSVLTVTVDDASALSPGLVEIGSEILYVQSISANTLSIAPDGRGWDGTTPASHSTAARVTANPPYPTWRLQQAVNDTITGIFPDVYGVASDSFTFNPSVSTYSVPAEAEDILRVTATVLGPSRDQVEINRYSFNSSAPVSEFASGNCITLGEAPDPGRTVTVTYTKAPSALASGDNFSVSGLRETARPCVIYGTVGRLLAFADSSRVLSDTAFGSDLSTSNDTRYLTATQLSSQMMARYQMELQKEQERLRKTNPPRVRWGR